MKNITILFVTLLSAGVLSGCAHLTSEKISYCYSLVEQPEAIVIITPQGEEFYGPEGPIFYDTIRIIDPEGEQKTIGEIREGSFYFGDGSRWEFNEQEAVGFGGLIEGMVAEKVECL